MDGETETNDTNQSGRGDVSPCFAIFERGGARAITHIGALKALEQERISIVGVAGTSAGAIVAALTAAGFKADELYRLDGDEQERDILSRSKKTPVDLLGRRDWRRLKRLLGSLWIVKVLGLIVAAAIVLTLVAVTGSRRSFIDPPLVGAIAAIVEQSIGKRPA